MEYARITQGMASITHHKGRWRAHVAKGGKRTSKVFRTRSEAVAWANRQESLREGGSGLTFGQAAERFLAWKLPQLDNPKNQAVYEQSVRDYALPVLGHKRLSEITRRDLVAVVTAIQDRVETAHRVGQRIRAIFDHAVDSGDIETHPAAGLSRILPSKTPKHIPSLPPGEFPALLKAIHSYPEPVTRIGLLLLAHTFVRTSELLGAQWSEIKSDVWLIPAERMKRRIPHVVPLTTHIRALLAELEPMTGESSYLLASPANERVPISSNTMLFALYRLGYRGRMTGHGFRSLASTILNESGLWSRDAIERQLAHKETDAIRAAYHRAEYLDERTRMMAWYGGHLAAMALRSST